MKKNIGILFILVGFLLSVLFPWSYILFGAPIYLIGVIIFWFGKSSNKTKLAWTIIPLLLWYPLVVFWLYSYNSIGKIKTQKRDYYVSEEFKGRLIIVESKCGKKPQVKDDRLQFEIPKNGIYFFNGELKSGHINRRVFVKQSSGEIIQLKDRIWPTKPEEKDTLGKEKVVGFWGGSFGTRTDQANKESNFISVNIETNKVYTDKQISRMYIKQDKLIEEQIASCNK